MEQVFENRDICASCGGKCCKKSGCDYTPSDFSDLSFNALYELLQQGNISIVSSLEFLLTPDGKYWVTPLLHLRARNINRPIVDLISMKTSCSQLLENGCKYSYEERPSGGKNLIPQPNDNCYTNIDLQVLMQEWNTYQKLLARLVRRFTGLSVDQQLRLDVENLIIDLLNSNVENVSEMELKEILGMVPHLTRAFPEETLKAKQKCEQASKVKTKNKLNI